MGGLAWQVKVTESMPTCGSSHSIDAAQAVLGWWWCLVGKKKSKSVKIIPLRCPGKNLTQILQRMPPRGWLGAESDGCQCHTASPRRVADVNVN